MKQYNGQHIGLAIIFATVKWAYVGEWGMCYQV